MRLLFSRLVCSATFQQHSLGFNENFLISSCICSLFWEGKGYLVDEASLIFFYYPKLYHFMYIHLDIHIDVHFAIQTIGTHNFGISRFTSIFVILNCQTHDPLLYSHLIKFNNFSSFITISEVVVGSPSIKNCYFSS